MGDRTTTIANGTRHVSRKYDVIVIGLGGMGSAALCALARRGKRVLGIEQFDIGHDLGSSAAGIRIYRFAQFLHPAYVPLMHHAFEHWSRLERDAEEQVLFRTGGLDVGLPASEVVTGAKLACTQHGLTHEVLRAKDAMQRFPAWQMSDDMEAVFQPDAGLLAADRAIFAHVRVALRLGADVQVRERVTAITEARDHVTIQTSRGRYEAGQVILTAGPWAAEWATSIGAKVVPERQVVGWFAPRVNALFGRAAFPVFIAEDETGVYYGLPEHDRPGMKLGRHGHRHEVTTPDDVRREIDATDEAVLTRFTRRYYGDRLGEVLALKTCMYTNTPDSHFVIDRLPEHGRSWLAAGFSGHGYKFCAGIGEILADLAIDGSTRQDISLFSAGRFGA
jgi:sarcosine oxidase